MKDRLKKDEDTIENLEDLIDAREERKKQFGEDIDSLQEDLEVPDVDPDHALTFPHPKDKHGSHQEPELMDTPKEEDVGFDFEDSTREMLPTDYAEDYEYATDTRPTDEDEEYLEDRVNDMGDIEAADLTDEVPVRETPEPGGFNPEEAEEEERQSTGG